jgi:hypothetical protein
LVNFFVSEIRYKSDWWRERVFLSFLMTRNGRRFLTLTLCWVCRNSYLVLIFSRPIVAQPHRDLKAWTLRLYLPTLYSLSLLNRWAAPTEIATAEFGRILKIRRRKGFCLRFLRQLFLILPHFWALFDEEKSFEKSN